MGGPLEPVADGLRLTLRVTPKASRNAIAGPADTAGAACLTTIGPKNLHGAALKSAATKCCKDAAKAAKLAGAAATSFDKKCVSDVVPATPPKS